MSEQNHVSVLLSEVLEALSPEDHKIYFDGTFGGGGYSNAILESADCRVIACDRDFTTKKYADELSEKYKNNKFMYSHAKYSDIENILLSFNVLKVDGIILDLGVSNFQFSEASRGFSFNLTGPIDMSMGLCEENALDVINNYCEKDLADIIYKYGEEHFSRRIAKNIKINLNSITNTFELAEVIRRCVKQKGKIDPATKTFQALRIFVNRELEELESLLYKSVNLLNDGGKLLIVSFHSLEDRLVKHFFKQITLRKIKNDNNFDINDTIPLICETNKKLFNDVEINNDNSYFELVNKKPIIPSENEIAINPKARSAKLRCVQFHVIS